MRVTMPKARAVLPSKCRSMGARRRRTTAGSERAELSTGGASGAIVIGA
jgi:hypothetical protein